QLSELKVGTTSFQNLTKSTTALLMPIAAASTPMFINSLEYLRAVCAENISGISKKAVSNFVFNSKNFYKDAFYFLTFELV
ncbi:MAG TPA: hypothetical protein PKL92_09810, partial [Aquaticitalea sp.]|nr:hypothetical protein [Aquaticitalea sp.]